MGETVDSLTCRSKEVIPAKIGITRAQTTSFDVNSNYKELLSNLNILKEQLETAMVRKVEYKQDMFKHYN